MADIRIGVRIVVQDDFTPGENDQENAKYATKAEERAEYRALAREAVAKHESGEWTAYGVMAVHECPACGEAHDGTASLWGIETETTTLANAVVWDLAEIGNEYLRELAAEVVADERAHIEDRATGANQ
jgi:hypothetical protein